MIFTQIIALVRSFNTQSEIHLDSATSGVGILHPIESWRGAGIGSHAEVRVQIIAAKSKNRMSNHSVHSHTSSSEIRAERMAATVDIA